jgi:rod shape-determining protein MreD
MRKLLLALLPAISLYLQSTLFSSYSIKGTVPDIILIFVVFYALFNGRGKGAIYGLACGLLEDLYMGRFLGLNALAKATVGYAVSKFQGNVFRENIIVGVITVVLGTLLNSVIVNLVALASFETFNVNTFLLISIMYQTCYNALLAIPLYIWYYHSTRTGTLKANGD